MIIKHWLLCKSPSTIKWMNKLWFVHRIEHTQRINYSCIQLGWISQTQRWLKEAKHKRVYTELFHLYQILVKTLILGDSSQKELGIDLKGTWQMFSWSEDQLHGDVYSLRKFTKLQFMSWSFFYKYIFFLKKKKKNKAAEDSGSCWGRDNWFQEGLHSALQFLFVS